MSKEAMKLALEALDEFCELGAIIRPLEVRDTLREALAEHCICGEPNTPGTHRTDGPCLAEQPAQQEPVVWPCLIAEADFSENTVTLAMQCTDYKVSAGKHWLSNTPPAQRTWVGLTKSEITTSLPYSVTRDKGCFHAGALWAEAKLKEKNT